MEADKVNGGDEVEDGQVTSVGVDMGVASENGIVDVEIAGDISVVIERLYTVNIIFV